MRRRRRPPICGKSRGYPGLPLRAALSTVRAAAWAAHPTRDAPVAQLDRVPDYGSGGWGFESSRARHFSQISGHSRALDGCRRSGRIAPARRVTPVLHGRSQPRGTKRGAGRSPLSATGRSRPGQRRQTPASRHVPAGRGAGPGTPLREIAGLIGDRRRKRVPAQLEEIQGAGQRSERCARTVRNRPQSPFGYGRKRNYG